MQLSKYESIGAENITVLIHEFYKGISSDSVLAPMYREGMEAAERRLKLFMVQLLGGPNTYSEERGHPRLRKRHQDFTMNSETRDRWLGHMKKALNDNNMSTDDKEYLWNYFEKTAYFLTE